MGVFLLPENPAFRRTARSRPHPIAFGMRTALFLGAGLFAAAELLQGGLRRAVAACHDGNRLVDHGVERRDAEKAVQVIHDKFFAI